MKALIHAVRSLSEGLVWCVNRVVVGLASVMLLAIGWQVFMRYLFNRPPPGPRNWRCCASPGVRC